MRAALSKLVHLCLLTAMFFTLHTSTILLTAANAGSTEEPVPPFSFLSTTLVGAHEFIKENPQYDGRGVVIFILDTGVDMGISGLKETSTGEVKVIDVRDFTGQGDVKLDSVRAKTIGFEQALEFDEGKLYHPDKLTYQPADGIYWMGWLDEKRFMNSPVKDLNENYESDDRFGIVAFPVEKKGESFWVCYVDLDNDCQLDDEQPLRDYNINYDTFQFTTKYEGGGKNSLTFALNIVPDKKTVSFHFDDGSHGTHVAGIAAGYKINGEEGFNGIAPGAKIISCKIGNNTLSGGATVSGSMKRAYDYVMEYSTTHDVPVVVNMSYGIGSEIAGRSKIETYLDKILKENEKVVVCVAAGNEGPGISTMGNPAGAGRVISTAALFPAETGRNLMNINAGENLVFFFSSRGGENAKPDVVSPGYAASTVPRFAPGEKYGGTSMASPQTAGCAALLLSALAQQSSPVHYTSTMVKRALKYSAVELPNTTFLDQGAGLVNVPGAYKLLMEYARKDSEECKVTYQIKTESPVYPGSSGETAYWRAGGYVPEGNKGQVFHVKAQFPEDTPPEQVENYFQSLYLHSTEPWLRINQTEIYLKEDHVTDIQLSYDLQLLKESGLYTGKVVAYERDSKGFEFAKSSAVFELWNTIIIPHYFTPENNYQQSFPYRRLSAGHIHRFFLAVPPGASGMYVSLKPSSNSACSVRPHIFNPEGKEFGRYSYAASEEGNTVEVSILGDELAAGIWEVDIYAGVSNNEDSIYDLIISFSGISAEPSVISLLDYEKGGYPAGRFTLLNMFSSPFTGSAEGTIEGFQTELKRTIKNCDRDTYSFTITDDIEKVEFKIEFTKETFNKFTDIAVNIFDKDGKALAGDALSYRSNTIQLDNVHPGTYTLEVVGGFTFPEDESEWEYQLTERWFHKEKVRITVSSNDSGSITCYPDYPVQCKLKLERAPRMIPSGTLCFGKIELISKGQEASAALIPILLDLKME